MGLSRRRLNGRGARRCRSWWTRRHAARFLPLALTEAALQCFFDEEVERATQDGAQIGAGHGVAEQVARQLDLSLELRVCRELDAVALG